MSTNSDKFLNDLFGPAFSLKISGATILLKP